MAGNHIGYNGAHAIGEALTKNNSLTELNLEVMAKKHEQVSII